MKDITTESIKLWARERDLHTADPNKQMLKLMEEVGELAQAIAKDKPESEVKGEIGDIYVVLTILSEQFGFDVRDCIKQAYDKIANRTGKMINGVYVKSDDL